VPVYRCYMLDRAGAIRDVEVVECRSDEEVRTAVADLLASDSIHAFSAVEVWDKGRVVLKEDADTLAESR
jgi:hypothetical protein